MGTACCKPESADKGYNRPVWQPEHPITAEELQQMRDQFWDTEPHYGGDRVIWDALKAACAADMATAKLILDTAGVTVAAQDMTVCYDERGSKYSLPPYVLSDPVDMGKASRGSGKVSSGGMVEMTAGSMAMAR